MRIDFSKTLTADHARCVALLAQVRDRSASWPAQWAATKKAGNRRQMNALLTEAEALASMQKVLQAAEIQMRTALLQREAVTNKIMLKQNREKDAQAGTSFSKRLTLRYQRATLEDTRKQLGRQTVRMGMDYLQLRMGEIGGVR